MRVIQNNEEKLQWKLIDATNRLANIEEKNLNINRQRNWRERWLFVIAIASLGVAAASLWIAGLALKVACLPR